MPEQEAVMPRWLYGLVLALPAASFARVSGASPLLVFILSALALVPLAGLIGEATERLANTVGERLGGLLNATFGNAAELIIGITALAAGLPTVVRASIAGSIIGNALLVLGTAMAAGGWRYGSQRFDGRVAGQYATMLALAVVGLVIPSVAAPLSGTPGPSGALATHRLSVVVALVLLGSYAAYIAFSVFGVRAERGEHGRAHRLRGEPARMPLARSEPEHGSRAGGPTERVATGRRNAGSASDEPRRRTGTAPSLRRPADDLWRAAATLAVATALTAVASELLVGAIDPVAREVGLSQFFIGLIILPIASNAAEHSSAIVAALRDRMEITMAITAGSSIQVALMVAPVLVLVGWGISRPLDLTFNVLELVIFALAAGLYALISLDGESTWLEGVQLFAFYIIVAASAFFVRA
jgi:Ca2+:H+ antiporter